MNRSLETQVRPKRGGQLSYFLKAAPVLVGAVLALAAAPQARAATATANGTVTVAVGSAANLSLSSNNLTFGSVDPATTPSVPPNEGDISVTVRMRTGRLFASALTVIASDDLKAGAQVIGIDNVTWTSSSPGFFAGTMDKALDQPVGAWVGPGSRTGLVAYRFANSYSYVTGTYTTSIIYTLTVP